MRGTELVGVAERPRFGDGDTILWKLASEKLHDFG
jgi:hypothetical protein